jgi:hypothetical protein
MSEQPVTAWKSASPNIRLPLGTATPRRPVTLVFSQHFQRIEDAISAERQIKGWRREKKEALIRGDYAALPALARRSSSQENAIPPVRPSRCGPQGRSSG